MTDKVYEIYSGQQKVGSVTINRNEATIAIDGQQALDIVNVYGWNDQKFLQAARQKIAELGIADPVLK